MNYKEKLDKLDRITEIEKTIKEVQDIDLVFDFATPNTLNEFGDIMSRIMAEFDIGKQVSKKFWGVRGYKDIQSVLLDSVKKAFQTRKRPSMLSIFDDLNTGVSGKKTKQYTNQDYARVARTEGKRITSLYQAKKFKEAGLEYVKYITRGDNKVSDVCRVKHNQEYKIDDILKPDNRGSPAPPTHPNCRCRLIASMKGIGAPAKPEDKKPSAWDEFQKRQILYRQGKL